MPHSSAPSGISLASAGRALLLAGLMLGRGAVGAEPVIHGLAIVRDDGTLLIRNQVVVLHGIYLAPTERQCRDWIRPVRCDARGVLALDFKVRGFITCLPRGEDDEGRMDAVCYVDRTGINAGEDLGAYLIEQGWALALPYAPFEYHALERIAAHQGRGVWGFIVDSISAPRP